MRSPVEREREREPRFLVCAPGVEQKERCRPTSDEISASSSRSDSVSGVVQPASPPRSDDMPPACVRLPSRRSCEPTSRAHMTSCETRKDFSAVPVRITTCIGGGAAEALGFHAIRASYVERSQRISERTSVTSASSRADATAASTAASTALLAPAVSRSFFAASSSASLASTCCACAAVLMICACEASSDSFVMSGDEWRPRLAPASKVLAKLEAIERFFFWPERSPSPEIVFPESSEDDGGAESSILGRVGTTSSCTAKVTPLRSILGKVTPADGNPMPTGAEPRRRSCRDGLRLPPPPPPPPP
mmetsp:Transcript_51783/g.137338  ORF Transcript_51783/g.137338 Transcript_51783/m.137338 type:complete len:306 (-) Transcript_51783:832-1749(-)